MASLFEVTVGSPPSDTVLNGIGAAQPESATIATKDSNHFIFFSSDERSVARNTMHRTISAQSQTGEQIGASRQVNHVEQNRHMGGGKG